MNALVIRLTWTDRDFLIEQEQASSSLIYVIMINMYKTHVAALMRNWYQSERATSRSKQSQLIWQLWNIKWDQLIADETHKEMIQTFKIIYLFKNMNEKSCKWFVTDTLFEWSFIQMMTWMNMLMTDSMMNQHESIWKEKEVHRVNLIYCTCQNLKEMNKIHMKIINLQEKSHRVIKKYIKELEIICDTLWLWCDVNLSKFFNSSFTNVKSNKHQDVNCKLSSMFNKLVNFSMMIITEQLQKNKDRKM